MSSGSSSCNHFNCKCDSHFHWRFILWWKTKSNQNKISWNTIYKSEEIYSTDVRVFTTSTSLIRINNKKILNVKL